MAYSVQKMTLSWEIEASQVVAFVTDNASYMLKAFNDILKLAFPNATHVTCMAHLMALVGSEWQNGLPLTQQAISNTRQLFCFGGKRKREYLELLREIEKPARLPPAPVATRWDTWFEMAEYLDDYFDAMSTFIKNMTDKKALYIREMYSTFDERADELKHELHFVTENCKGTVFLLKYFQSNNVNAATVHNIMND